MAYPETQLFKTPSFTSRDGSSMHCPPIKRALSAFDSLPANDLEVIALPAMMDGPDTENSLWECRGSFILPKVNAKRKRFFHDMISKMADQGATQLSLFEGKEAAEFHVQNGAVSPEGKGNSLGLLDSKRQSVQAFRRYSNNAVCA